MSRHELDAESAMDRSEPSSGCWRGLTVRRAVLVMSLVVALLLSVVAVASATSSFYWYGEGNSTCWQTGQLGAPSDACSNVGAGYLPTPGGHTGGLEWMDEGAANSADFLSPSGDYCTYYKLGDNLTSQISTNEGPATGFTTPTPYSSYQEGDAHNNVCQADGSHWGREIRDTALGNSCFEVCGMGHYVSLRSQGTNDRPWSGEFGEPSLVISAEDDPQTFTATGTNVGAWGYLCPQLEDTATGDILEYCLQEWRGEHNESKWEQEGVTECVSVNGHNKDLVSSYFWPGTQFVTERSGSTNTYVWKSSGGHHFEAAVTKADLVNAINRDRTEYVQGKRPGEPAPGKGCGRSLSTNPESYALIGVSQGSEGWREVTELAGNTANLQLRTEYTPIPPEATTSAASEVQQTQAKLNGTVNPKGTDTHYYFQYGKTTEYGLSTASNDAGSGMSSLPENATVTGLEPSTTYHYRLVATSEGGTVYGSDKTFKTAGGSSPSAAIVESTGYQVIDYVNSSEGISYWSYSSGTGWSNVTLGGQVASGTSPSVALIPSTGYQVVYYVNSSGGISYWSYVAGTGWSNVTLGGQVAPGTSPSIYVSQSSAYQVAYYQNSGGGISYWSYQPSTGWTNGSLGGHAASGSSPDVAVVPSTGYQVIYYQNSSGGISFWSWASGSGWINDSIGGQVAPYTSPSIAIAPSTGYQVAYYQNSSKGISYWSYLPSTGWTNGTL